MRTKKDTQWSLTRLAMHPGANPTSWGALVAVLTDLVDRLPDGETVPAPDTRREDERLGAKYRVERTSDPTGKHEECGYFVLDPRHDPHAVTAIRAYSAAVRSERPGLADDLDAWVGAPVSDTRREAAEALCTADSSYWHHEQTDAYPCTSCVEKVGIVLAVLPAPPVDDGGWTVADWEEWANEVAATLPEDCDGDEAQVEIIAKFVRRAAAPPVVDEAALGDLWDAGNACGLDGWVGPGRGSDEIDDEAVRRRERDVAKTAAHLSGENR